MLPSRASVVVAGGGPAGYMAAIAAAEAGATDLVILEATAEPLYKVRISGGGRCNVTHACWDPRALVGHYPRGGQALRGPFSRFASGDTVAWFDAHGLELVEEADGRLFPRSNRSSSVIDTLRRAARVAGVRCLEGQALQAAEPLATGGFRLTLRGGVQLEAERLVLATGSHPSGLRIAAALGHGRVPPVPSLFTLALGRHPLTALAGVVVDPVVLELEPPGDPAAPEAVATTSPAAAVAPIPVEPPAALPRPAGGRRVERHRQRGPLLITHWGFSGPAILRLTAFAARDLRAWGYRASLRVDWTGGLPAADLEERFATARREQARRQLGTVRPWPGLGRRLWLHLLEANGVAADLRWADLGRGDQRRLVEALRQSRYAITGRGPFGEEFVTAGGVPLGEVNLATMESRRQRGLFLVGELLDVDGVTGGFNFQHCWSSGWLAGQALASGGEDSA
ncbi:MAG: NAD(P)/FAD-dependent oxidoreductase [Cyanobium sp. ELA507]